MQEYQASCFIQSRMENVPKVYSLCVRENRFGIIYEKVVGRSLMEEMLDKTSIDSSANLFLQTQMEIHNRSVSTDQIPSVKDKLLNDIMCINDFSSKQKEYLAAYIRSLPDGNALCHFDFHPGNVIMQGERPVIIDWMTACFGDPCADLARTYLLLRYGELSDESDEFIEKIKTLKKQLLNIYCKQVIGQSDETVNNFKAWILPIAAARLQEWIPKKERENLLSIVNQKIPF